jgi:hypothetical protein
MKKIVLTVVLCLCAIALAQSGESGAGAAARERSIRDVRDSEQRQIDGAAAAALQKAIAATSQPSPQEAYDAVLSPYKGRIALAQQRVQEADSVAKASAHAKPEFVVQAQKLADAESELLKARKGGDAQARLRASSAYNREREKLRQVETALLGEDQSLAAAKANVESAFRELAANQSAATQKRDEQKRKIEALIEADPVLKGLRDHRLAVGMTFEQASALFTERAEHVGETGGGVNIYRWTYYIPSGFADRPPEYSGTTIAYFKQGKLCSFEGSSQQ